MLLVAVFVFGIDPPALLAHAKLVSSNPPAGAKLVAPPREIRLVFSEKPELSLCVVRLIRSGRDTVALSALRYDSSDSRAVVAAIVADLPSGEYQISWIVASRDGHPVRGAVPFTVAAGQATGEGPMPPAQPTVPPGSEDTSIAMTGALGSIAIRWLSFVSVFLVIGVVTFSLVVLPRVSPGTGDTFSLMATTNAATLGLAASAGVVLAAALKLGREAADMPDVAATQMVFGSSWGRSVLFQILGGLVAAYAFLVMHRGSPESRKRASLIAVTAAAALAVAASLGGHAASSSRAFLSIPADMVHVAAGGMWLGTLAVIMVVGISAALKTPDTIRPGARLAAMINVFSPIALTCGASVAATGIASSLVHLPSVAALWTTPYGVVLLLKLLFVALLFAAGAWNWQRMKPRLTGDDAIVPMRSMASLELILAAAVLGITAVLVALELP